MLYDCPCVYRDLLRKVWIEGSEEQAEIGSGTAA